MKLPFRRWMAGVFFCLTTLCAHAQLVALPEFTAIGVPATASFNETVTISATAQATYSDNSDGNDWNTPNYIRILRITITVDAPNGSSSVINDWMPTEVSPNSVSVPLTVDQTGTWFVSFTTMDGRPWYYSAGAYTITVSPPPGPLITSSLGVSVNEGQQVNYQIVATNSPSSYGATGLPAGLSLNTTTGVISGRITSSSNVSSTIQASNANGTDTKTLTWYVTAASIAPGGSVGPQNISLGQSVTVTRNPSANFGVWYTQATVWRPDNSYYELPLMTGNGSSNYTPDGGRGVYWVQYRVVDNNQNYVDQWIAFYVMDVDPITVTVTPGGQTYDGRTTNPPISFGQSVTVNATAHDPSGQMTQTSIAGDFGISGHWAGYGGADSFSASASHSFSATYQPTAIGTGSHFMGAYGYSNGWWGRGFSLLVSKATPTGSFLNRSLTANGSGYYVVTSGDLNATFANPYSGAVSAPTGSVSYRFTATGTSVTTGTQLASGAVHSIDALYPGDGNYTSSIKTAAFTVTAPAVPPTINSSLVASGPVGVAFNYTITASGTPTGFNATGLPGGLNVNTSTGVISGIPATTGTTNVGLSATNAHGTGTATLVLTITVNDSDSDSMDDNWEVTYFGSIGARNGTLDFDGDGLIDRDEYTFGLNPTVSNSGNPAERANFTYTKNDELNTYTPKTGSASNYNPDAEGNLLP